MEETKKVKQRKEIKKVKQILEQEKQNAFTLQTVYTMIILNWQWLVLSLIICLGAAAIYLRYKTPIYQTSAKVLI